jgi:hypothetical protein
LRQAEIDIHRHVARPYPSTYASRMGLAGELSANQQREQYLMSTRAALSLSTPLEGLMAEEDHNMMGKTRPPGKK